jgi:ABC-type branched-subunit amino acid transport system ATPase component
VLDIRHLEVAYGHARVIHDLNLTLAPGEMVFIVGRNGAGKTTLLKTIAGLLKPTQGEIVFDGRPVAGERPEKLARSGFRFVAQDKKVFSSLSVRSNIELAAHGAGEPVEEAWKKAIEIYPKLAEFRALPAGRLSGGQREILLIGRALVGNPRLLLIDEPTEGLAAGTINDILNVLAMMKGKVSMVIVEQNLSVVGMLADKVFMMHEGKIIKELTERSEISNKSQLEQYL